MVLPERPQMNSSDGPGREAMLAQLIVLVACSSAVLLALLALVGWVTNFHALASIARVSIPMPPTTAILFVLTGVSLPLNHKRSALRLRSILFVLSGLIAAAGLAGDLFGSPFTLDSLLVPHPATGASIPMAQISPVSSATFLITALLCVVPLGVGRKYGFPALFGLLPTGLGFSISLGYFYGHPLFYSSSIIPVAFTTGLCFFLFGIALTVEPGIEQLPMRMFVGASTRARLFRRLVPAVPAAILADALLVDPLPVSNPAIKTTVFGVVAVIVVAAAILSATHTVGRSIDRTMGILAESEGELRAIFNGTMDAMLIVETDGRVIDANPAACFLFGLSLESLCRTDLFALSLLGEDSDKFWSRFLRLGRVKGSSRLPIQDDAAREIEYSMTANILHGRHLVVLRDVTESRMRMLESERLAAIVGSTSDAIYSKDTDGRIVSWNAAASRIFGFSEEEVLGRTEEILFPNHREEVASSTEGRGSNGDSSPGFEVEARSRDGRKLSVSISASPILDEFGNRIGTSVIARDVTGHRQAERTHAEDTARLRAFFDSRAVGILFGDIDGSVFDANDLFLEMIGYSREELTSNSIRWTNITPPAFFPLDEYSISEARRFGACRPYEKQYIRKDGTAFWVLVGFVLLEPDRRRSVAFIIDIDEKKHTEEALHRSEERFSRMFRSSPVAVGMSEFATGRIIDVNDQWLDLYGYTREECIGRTTLELNLWADQNDRAPLFEQIDRGEPVAQAEVDQRRKDGEIRHTIISLTTSNLASDAARVLIVTIVDITERRELQRQLEQSQKMEAVGRLAGGVAHDFNNMLGVIIGFAELIEKNIREEDRHKIEQVIAAANRAAALTNQLLAFSRRQLLEPKVVDMNGLVTGLAAMLGRLIGEDIHLETELDPELGQVNADPGQIEQVIMNLAVNSRDAMPEGGTLRISTANTELDESFTLPDEPIVPGRYVVLSVTDTGTGIDEETVSHLFEPFFTTKEQGKGTGLGLSTAYGIVKQSAGYFWVSSEVGAGTTFKIFLPRLSAVPPAAKPSLPPDGEQRSGTETILLVEDESTLRAMITELLTAQGYAVLTAENGPDALARADGGPVHLLISDVIMPKMTGIELAHKLVERAPKLKVLFISGYTADTEELKELLATNARLLSKPFSNSQLLEHVRQLLDGRHD